jgi:hypothetical protein
VVPSRLISGRLLIFVASVMAKISTICQEETVACKKWQVDAKAREAVLSYFPAFLIGLICHRAKDDAGRREGQSRAWIVARRSSCP